MNFKFEHKKYKTKECETEVYSNEEGIVVKFFNKEMEPKADKIIDYVFVDAGYGYLSLKRKGEDAIISGLLKKDFFSNTVIIHQAIDYISSLLPDLQDAYIPYNIEQITIFDTLTETFDDLKENK